MEYRKAHTAPKDVVQQGKVLEDKKTEVFKKISAMVGVTLGPGGQVVVIERWEPDMLPVVTKDGVTVFKALSEYDPVKQAILEVARDASLRTAKEAGDGTTTTAILSAAIHEGMRKYIENNPRISPQRVMRKIEEVFSNTIEPAIKKYSRKVDLSNEDDRGILHSVAKISANGDVPLADSVMRAFDICGDDGNITLEEHNGLSRYEEEKIDGYPIMIGYEECCAKYYPKFVNDVGRQLSVLEDPAFLLFNGDITELASLKPFIEKFGIAYEKSLMGGRPSPRNLVIVALGFSESVLTQLAVNFESPKSVIKVYPLTAPRTVQAQSQLEFLLDLSAITGAQVLDVMKTRLEQAELDILGNRNRVPGSPEGITAFEANRARTMIHGYADEVLLAMRIEELRQRLINPASSLDAVLTEERIAKLAGGIAKLKVFGSSKSETKEKVDRAEDAVCAVRGAIAHGCLPGGAWMLLKLTKLLPEGDSIIDEVLRPAFMEPFVRLLTNCGITNEDECRDIFGPIMEGINDEKAVVYDFLDGKHVDPYLAGILDSTPAVLEAIRNSISIALRTGTTGGVIAYSRDVAFERTEAASESEYYKHT